jgi:hypothetical protein
MAALPVVEDLDVFEERGLRLAPRSKPRAMHEFGLESAEEALHWGVVQAVPFFLLIEAVMPFALSSLR